MAVAAVFQWVKAALAAPSAAQRPQSRHRFLDSSAPGDSDATLSAKLSQPTGGHEQHETRIQRRK